ncbi:MAG: GTPase Era [Nitrospinae bacterium]|nr:GTPase Era [Nitrospinota bacterium]
MRTQRLTAYRSGYCCILGRPNAGKSTLLNRFCGEKVAIVTDKPQTTRDMITAMKTTPSAQIIFLDTPGLHESPKELNKIMQAAAKNAAESADMLLVIFDPREKSAREDLHLARQLAGSAKPVIAAINKIDLVDKLMLLPVMQMLADEGIADIYPVSAKTGEGVEALEQGIAAYLPEGPMLYPEDQLTDQNERFLAAEIIREKLFQYTHKEIPYSSAVIVEEYKERNEKLNAVRAVIYVERDSQRGIVIGQGGQMIKQIGQAAREELEQRFGKKFFLELNVKTRKDWTKDEKFLKEIERQYKG